MAVLCRLPRDFFDTWPAQGYLINLSALASAQLGRTICYARPSIFKQLLHTYTLNDPPVPAEQAAVAAAVPEAPTQAHALIAAEDDLAAHLADREVEQGIVARLAGQAGAAPDHFRCAGWVDGVTPLRAPAECAEECLRPRWRGGTSWWVREGMVMSVASSRLDRVSIMSRGSTVPWHVGHVQGWRSEVVGYLQIINERK